MPRLEAMKLKRQEELLKASEAKVHSLEESQQRQQETKRVLNMKHIPPRRQQSVSFLVECSKIL